MALEARKLLEKGCELLINRYSVLEPLGKHTEKMEEDYQNWLASWDSPGKDYPFNAENSREGQRVSPMTDSEILERAEQIKKERDQEEADSWRDMDNAMEASHGE
jgi:hypothetical protein